MQRLKEKGPWPSSLPSSWQEGESRRCLLALGSGRGVGRSMPGSPPPQTAGSLPSNDPDGPGWGLCLQASGLRTLAPSHPPASTLQPREAGGGRRRALRPPLGEPAPAAGTRAQLPGSGGSAPSCACAGGVRYANGAASNRGSAAPRRARRRVVREYAELRRRRVPGVPRGGRRQAAAVLGRPRLGRRPGAHARSRQSPRFSSPFPTEMAPPGRGRPRLPRARFLKKTSAHSQDGPRAPPSGAEPTEPAAGGGGGACPPPSPGAVPLTWPAACQAQSPPRAARPPSRGLDPLHCAEAVTPPGALPLIPRPPRRRGGCPAACGGARGSHSEEDRSAG